MSIHPLQLARAALAAFLAVLLVACGGGGGNIPAARDGLRLLSSEFSTRTSVSYSPFRSSDRDTETITESMIKQDLDLLVATGIGLIRLFDSSDMVAKQTLQVIKNNNLNLKVMLGMYVQSDKYASDADKPAIAAYNQAEMARGVELAKQYSDIVLAVSVGNETMVSWSFNKIDPVVMTGFITNVRGQITQPVTTDDNWAFYGDAPSNVINAIDFASVHVYPELDTTVFDLVYADIEKNVPADKQAEAIAANATLWDWEQQAVPEAQRAVAMMDASLVAAKRQYQIVRNFLDERNLSAMPIVIGETGWNAVDLGKLQYRAHPVNQQMYYQRLLAWADEGKTGAGPKAVIYFEAFDEPWKQGDDKWGLFNVDRQARYVIQSLGTCGVTWTCEPGTYTAADAVYYKPLVVSPPVTANRYRVYADVAVSGEALPAEIPFWVGWGGSKGDTAFTGELTTDNTSGDAPTTREIQPAPEVWGWGMIAALVTTTENLTNFETAGRLNFSVKTTYPGKVEIGFLTGTTTTSTAYDVYLPIDPANNPYGYKNDGAWHQVSIPISAITPYGKMAFGMTDPSKSKLDLTKVTNPFVIADRYAVTGKTTGFAGNTEKIYVDAVYWSK